MKPISVLQVLFSLTLWKMVATLPQTSINGDPTKGSSKSNSDALQLMGNPEPTSCQGTQNSWSKGQPLWGKLQLAERLSLFQNVWNEGQLQPDSSNEIVCRVFSGGVLSWMVKFDMNSVPGSHNQVKSYTNTGWYGSPKLIRSVKVFKSTWNWKLLKPSNDIILDISYDIFTAKDGNCKSQDCASTEVMVWLAAFGGASPASSTGSPVGAIETRGDKYTYAFDVWKGVVSNKPVISLVPKNQRKYTAFSADFKDIFKKLEPFGLDPNQYIVNVGAGPEVFQGKGTLDTTSYSLTITSNGS